MNLRVQGAKLLGGFIRATGRGGGTTLPGRALLAVEPDALGRLGANLTGGSILVSATNGKTTTASLLSSILSEAGRTVVANGAGSNMPWGIVTALIEGQDGTGLFEVDEAWLPRVSRELEPDVVVLGNLFRDQLDRYGETEQVADRWAELARSLPATTKFAVNADDPIVAEVGLNASGEAIFFGIDDPAAALAAQPHAADARRCRRCNERLSFERTYLGHLGIYSCPACGATRPEPDLIASAIELIGTESVRAMITFRGDEYRLELPLPGVYNLYNALGALAGAVADGIALPLAVQALAGVEPVFGRAERLVVDGTETTILLIKNPVGANEVIRTLGTGSGEFDLWIGLNDRIADGRDVSWIWDADFEELPGGIGRVTCAGTRAAEMALRLKYGGIDPGRIEIDPAIGPSFDRAASTATGDLYVLPTYTALLELEGHVRDRVDLAPYWTGATG